MFVDNLSPEMESERLRRRILSQREILLRKINYIILIQTCSIPHSTSLALVKSLFAGWYPSTQWAMDVNTSQIKATCKCFSLRQWANSLTCRVVLHLGSDVVLVRRFALTPSTGPLWHRSNKWEVKLQFNLKRGTISKLYPFLQVGVTVWARGLVCGFNSLTGRQILASFLKEVWGLFEFFFFY